MEFEIELHGLDELASRFRGAKQIILDELLRTMQRIVLQGTNIAKGLVARDTSHLHRSIQPESKPISGGVRGVWGTNVPYGIFVEEGRSAGKMPPKGALLGWMGRKGIDASLEYVIRRAIGRRGTPAQPFMEPSFQKIRSIAPREFTAAMERIVAKLGGR